jgi:cobalt-zinc-cadmium efflux system outer membrane protein
LRYSLRTDLEEVQHLLKIRIVYDAEIAEVQKLVTGMDAEFAAGNIPLKDNIRVKALLFSLQNEVINVENQLVPIQAELSVLLQEQSHRFIQPVFTFHLPTLIKASIPAIDSLEKVALENRYDLKAAQTSLVYQQHNLVYQKALAKADFSVGAEYDRFNSYAPNYVGLAISVPLNVFNRNQGNIKSAELSIQSQKALSEQTASKVLTDVYATYSKFVFFQHINDAAQLDFSNQYDRLFLNMLKSYQDRQLSLLEFIDFMDAYKDTKLKLVEQHNGLVKSLEDLNYAIGKDVIKIN